MRVRLLLRILVLGFLCGLGSCGGTPSGPFLRGKLVAAYDSAFAINRVLGTVSAWGDNSHGQLGDGTVNPSPSPLTVGGSLGGVAGLAAGQSFAVALTTDGMVWAWGRGDSSQLATASATDSHLPTQIPNLSSVTAIAAGSAHVLALKSDGSVWAWGLNSHGQVGDGTAGNNRAVPTQVAGLTGGVTQIAAGYRFSVAVKNDGSVWTWGEDTKGELGDNSAAGTLRAVPAQVANLVAITAVAAAGEYVLALSQDGTLWAWGDNSTGNLGDGTTTQRGAPVQVTSFSDFTLIGAGTASFAVRHDGSVWAWGDNTKGTFGITTSQPIVPTPAPAGSIYDVTQIAPGVGFTVFRNTNGSVHATGADDEGQLGTGSSSPTPQFTPVLVPGLST